MSAQSRIHYPVTLEDLRTNPAIIAHWPEVSNLIQGFLMTMLVKNATAVEGGSRAVDEAAAMHVVGIILEQLRSLTGEAASPAPRAPMRPLNRFSTSEKTENPSTTT